MGQLPIFLSFSLSCSSSLRSRSSSPGPFLLYKAVVCSRLFSLPTPSPPDRSLTLIGCLSLLLFPKSLNTF